MIAGSFHPLFGDQVKWSASSFDRSWIERDFAAEIARLSFPTIENTQAENSPSFLMIEGFRGA